MANMCANLYAPWSEEDGYDIHLTVSSTGSDPLAWLEANGLTIFCRTSELADRWAKKFMEMAIELKAKELTVDEGSSEGT